MFVKEGGSADLALALGGLAAAAAAWGDAGDADASRWADAADAGAGAARGDAADADAAGWADADASNAVTLTGTAFLEGGPRKKKSP